MSPGIHHSADVEAESLYEAVVLAVRRFRQDPWIPQVGTATVLDVEVREPSTKHSISPFSRSNGGLAVRRRIRPRL
jgi:hypothetical protein